MHKKVCLSKGILILVNPLGLVVWIMITGPRSTHEMMTSRVDCTYFQVACLCVRRSCRSRQFRQLE